MPHQHQRIALLGELDRLQMHLRHQRAGRVDHLQLPLLARAPAPPARRHGPSRSPAPPPGPRPARSRRSRPSSPGPSQHSCYARSPCARRSERQTSPAQSAQCRWRALRPAQKPRGFNSSTRLVGTAVPLCSRSGESIVVVVTALSIPCPSLPRHLSKTPGLFLQSAHSSKSIAHGWYTNLHKSTINFSRRHRTSTREV